MSAFQRKPAIPIMIKVRCRPVLRCVAAAAIGIGNFPSLDLKNTIELPVMNILVATDTQLCPRIKWQ